MPVQNPYEILVALAECGSLSAAARRLKITQPGMTKALQRLEFDLGAPLVERSARGMHFTVFGNAVLGHARLIDATLDKVREELRQLRGEQEGRIAMAVSHAACGVLLPQVLRRFRDNWPSVFVRVAAGVFPGLLVPLREGRIDLAVVPLPNHPLPAEFDQQPLMTTRLSVVARQGHPLARATRLSELAGADWVLPGIESGSGRALSEAFARHALGSPHCLTVCESLTAMQALIGASDALGVMPADEAPLALFARPGLTALKLKETVQGPHLHLISRAGAQQTPALRRLCALFVDEAQSMARTDGRLD